MKQEKFSQASTLTSAAAVVASLVIATPLAPQLLASVVIPAKNEAERLPQTLAALGTQVDFAGQPLDPRSYEVIVLANNCDDATALVARRFAQAHPHLAVHVVEIMLPVAEAHVGRARRLLMDEACRRLEHTRNPKKLFKLSEQVGECWPRRARHWREQFCVRSLSPSGDYCLPRQCCAPPPSVSRG